MQKFRPFWAFHYLDLITCSCLINECLWKIVKLIWNRFEKVGNICISDQNRYCASVWQSINYVNSTKATLLPRPRSLILPLHPSLYPSNNKRAERSEAERVRLRCPSISRRRRGLAEGRRRLGSAVLWQKKKERERKMGQIEIESRKCSKEMDEMEKRREEEV